MIVYGSHVIAELFGWLKEVINWKWDIAVTLSSFDIFSIISAEINHLCVCVCVIGWFPGLATPSGLLTDTDAAQKLARSHDLFLYFSISLSLSLPLLRPDLFVFFFSSTLNLFYHSPAVTLILSLSCFLRTSQKCIQVIKLHSDVFL